jgi:probable rRNA maturation factor
MAVFVNGSALGRSIDRNALRCVGRVSLLVLGLDERELSITLVSDARIAELAGRFGRAPRPTDVLAFPVDEGPFAGLASDCLGDVVISVETAERQAHERGRDLGRELRDLAIHGILHLAGMDHHRADETRRMRALEDLMRWEIERCC